MNDPNESFGEQKTDILGPIPKNVTTTPSTQRGVLLTPSTKGPKETKQVKTMFDFSRPDKCMEQQEMLKELTLLSKTKLAVLQENSLHSNKTNVHTMILS